MNSISSVQWQHTNQYSLPLGLSLLHLKLQPRGRQTAQHISWSQGHSTSPLISESILWTSIPVWTTPDTIMHPSWNSCLTKQDQRNTGLRISTAILLWPPKYCVFLKIYIWWMESHIVRHPLLMTFLVVN